MTTFTIKTTNRSVTYAARAVASIEMTTSGVGISPRQTFLGVRCNNGNTDFFDFGENVDAAERAMAAAKEAMAEA